MALELRTRPLAYNNIDGVGELSMGFMVLGSGLLSWLQVSTPQNSIWNQIYTFYIFFGAICAIAHYGSKAIKNRLTYPRTGFVEYRRRDTVWRPAILGLVVSAVGSAGFYLALRSHWAGFTTPASLVGLIFAASYAYGIARTVPWKWMVVAIMTLGSLAIAALPGEWIGAPAMHSWIIRMFPAKIVGAFLFSFLLYGTLLLISGGITFCSYLRTSKEVLE